MPETDSSSNSRRMNGVLRSKLREGARRLRDMHAARRDARTSCGRPKQEYLRAVHRILSIHLGTPPERFAWQWRDKDGAFHRTEELTPQQFASRVRRPAAGRVRLPGPRPAAGQPATAGPIRSQYLGNVVGGQRVHVPERRDGADEAHRPAHARGRRAGLVRLRRRQADAARPRADGSRPVRPRGGVRRAVRRWTRRRGWSTARRR